MPWFAGMLVITSIMLIFGSAISKAPIPANVFVLFILHILALICCHLNRSILFGPK